ncbi:hypothetical protein [Nostocoides australiense]
MKSLFDIGLPVLPTKDDPDRAPDDLPWTVQQLRTAQRQGTQVHEIIAAVAGTNDLATDPIATIRDAAKTIVTGRANGRVAQARLRVTGLAVQYAQLFLPANATLIATERQPVTGGRADLLWLHPTVGYFYDEVKTHRLTPRVEEAALKQMTTYRTAGVTELHTHFAGVRLICLGNARSSLLMTKDGEIVALHESALSPAALRIAPTRTAAS